MKKRIFVTIVLAVVLALATCLFVACGPKKTFSPADPSGEHTHSYSSTWSYNETEHWHAATCGHTTETKDKSAHTYNQNGKCTVCNYEHAHSYSSTWSYDENEHWQAATCGHKTEPKGKTAHTYNQNGKCTVCNYEHAHSYSSTWSYDETDHWYAATCGHTTEPKGKIAHTYQNGKCTVCKYEHKNHIFGDWITDVPATETSAGSRHKECFCGKTVEEEIPQADLFVYETFANGYAIKSYLGTQATIDVPATHDGKPVLAISERAFYYGDFEKITLPDTIKEIGQEAFGYCANLKEIVIPACIRIGNRAFFSCSALDEIVLPENANVLGDELFCYCNKLDKVTILGGAIGENTLKSCVATEIVAGKNVSTVAQNAFAGCNKLVALTLPEVLENVPFMDYYFNAARELYTVTGYDDTELSPAETRGYQYGNTHFGLPVDGTDWYYRYGTKTIDGVEYIYSGKPVKVLSSDRVYDITANAYWSRPTKWTGEFYRVPEISLKTLTITEQLIAVDNEVFRDCACKINVLHKFPIVSVAPVKDSGFIPDELYGNLRLRITRTEGPEEYVYLQEEYLSEADRKALEEKGTHKVTVMLEGGKYETSITIIYGTFENAKLESKEFARDGSPKSLFVAGVLEGTEIVYTGNEQTEYGLWTVTAQLSKRYYEPTTLTATLAITSGEGLFNVRNGVLTGVTAAAKDKTELYIASLANITSIGENAFKDLTALQSVIIPAEITSIGNKAFSGCTALESVTFVNRSAALTVGQNVFYNCDRLQTISVDGAEGKYTSDGNCLIYDGSKLVLACKSSRIPTTVTALGRYAFSGCHDLTIEIPSSVTQIEAGAFAGCDGLVSITLPFVGDGPHKSTDTYQYPFGYIFGTSSYDGGAETKQWYYGSSTSSTTSTTYYIPTSLRSVTITGSKYIPYGAFYNCNKLSEIAVSSSVTSIGSNAFYNCTGLTSVTISNGVTSIGNSAFASCTGLKTVNWNATKCTKAGSDTNPIFRDCIQLATVNIGANVKSIPAYAFLRCTGLTAVHITDLAAWCNIDFGNGSANPLEYAKHLYIDGQKLSETLEGTLEIPNGVTKIPDYTFYDCEKITSVTIPDSVTRIGESAFYNCDSLTAVHIEDIAAWCNIDFGDSYSANPLYYAHHLYKDGTEIKDLEIPQGVMETKAYAFSGCEGLTSVTIPESVTSIGSNAFYNCTGLTSVTIGNGVTSITFQAFANCTSLTSVTIPDSVTSIGWDAFENCTGLTAVHITDITAWCNIDFSNYSANPLYNAKEKHLYKDGQELNGALVIPNGVTKIPDYTFYDCEKITSVTIPDSVTRIGESAFGGCKNLESITIPFVGDKPHKSTDTNQYPFGYIFGTSSYDGGTATQQYYYGSDTRWTTSTTYYIPATLKTVTITGSKYIPYGAFYNCTGLESVTIGNGVTSIGDGAFRGCTGLTSVAIPDSVTSIGNSAFYNCTGLTSITIPESVTSIGSYAFYNTGLTSVTIPESVTSIWERAFSGCTNLATVNWNATNCTEAGSSDSSRIFGDCTQLTTVNIGANVKSIPAYTFYGCDNLTAVYITDIAAWCNIDFGDWSANPLYYAKHLYKDGKEIQDLEIPQGVTKIKDRTFYHCEKITSVTIPDSVTGIGSYAFSGCTGLTSVTIPDSVTSIGEGAFSGCEKLVEVFNHSTHITVKKGDEGNGSVGYYALGVYNDTTTQSKIVDKDGYLFYNGDTVYLFGYTGTDKALVLPNDFEGKPYEISQYAFYERSDITSVTIPKSVTSIGDSAFYYCKGLTSITIPDSVTSIGNRAFYNCTGLTSVTIGNGVTSIGWGAFCYCKGLTSVTIPESVTSIESRAFEGCNKLVEVLNRSTHITVEKGDDGNGYVGYYALGVYNDATTQSKIVDKDGYRFYNGDTVYLFGYTGTDKDLVLPDDFEGKPYEISQYAFYGRSDITSVTIPDSVTSIGSSAFYGCKGLTSVTIPESVTSIGDSAFYGCKGLTSVTIPESVTSIGDSAFADTGLRSVTIGSGVTSIGDGAFNGCKGLTSITIPDSVTSIGRYTFYGCTGLTSAVFKNPSGWKVSKYSDMSPASSVTVSNASTAAQYLRDTYDNYYWHRY